MDELPPHARRLLEIVRSLDDPQPQRRASADAALRTALAAHGVTNLPPLAAASSLAAFAAVRSGTQLSMGMKIALGAGAIAALASGVWHLRTDPRTTSVPAAPPALALPPAPDVARPTPAEDADAATPRLTLRAPSMKRPHVRPPTPDADSALRTELQLLAAVDGMLRGGRYAEALRKLSDSEPAAGSSVLAEERRALRVLALCGAGHATASHERERFLASAPRSVLAERVRAACTAPMAAP